MGGLWRAGGQEADGRTGGRGAKERRMGRWRMGGRADGTENGGGRADGCGRGADRADWRSGGRADKQGV